MTSRRVQPEVQKLFEKHVTSVGNVIVRRLNRADALSMLDQEFGLQQTHAEQLLDYFDADRNGSLSLWEFQHFYNLAGPRSKELVAQFEELDTNNQGFLTNVQMSEALHGLCPSEGSTINEQDMSMLLKSSRQADHIQLADYIAITYRLNMMITKRAR